MGQPALHAAGHPRPLAGLIRLPRASLAQVWLVAPPALVALAGSSMPIEAIDVWWSLLLDGAGPADPIVFTPLIGPTANVQWLAQRLLAELYALGGLGSLVALRALVLALVAGLLELLVLRSGGSPRQAALAAILALPSLVAGAALRPQLLAMPLFALVLLLGGPLVRRRGSRPAIGLVAAIWANVHGSFVLAPLALVLLAVGAARPVAVERLHLAAITLGAALLNPWGPEAYAAVLEVTRANGGGAGSLALEWRPLEFGSTPGVLFLFQVIAAVLGVRRLGRTALCWAVLALTFGLLAVSSGRHTIWFALAVAPLAAQAVGGPRGGPRPGTAAAGLLMAALLFLGCYGLLRPLLSAEQRLAVDTPVRLADRLEPLQPRRVFAYSDWGGYLAWRLRPDGRVYIDNRFEQHSAETWASYRSASLAEPGWERMLDDAEVDALALDRRRQAPLIEAAEASTNWRLIHTDERTALLVRPRAVPSGPGPTFSPVRPIPSSPFDAEEATRGGQPE